eukprot:TRINITY_DN10200_c0_g1_i2.p1 TRINITY_DN10200_c0_g1~~TRINITY_DN10200_c0_g1_i2.p1  ORF type:complete len:1358 (+),score=347.86 TRINITY_DN10200_c0_g1_i2:615-4688(+)
MADAESECDGLRAAFDAEMQRLEMKARDAEDAREAEFAKAQALKDAAAEMAVELRAATTRRAAQEQQEHVEHDLRRRETARLLDDISRQGQVVETLEAALSQTQKDLLRALHLGGQLQAETEYMLATHKRQQDRLLIAKSELIELGGLSRRQELRIENLEDQLRQLRGSAAAVGEEEGAEPCLAPEDPENAIADALTPVRDADGSPEVAAHVNPLVQHAALRQQPSMETTSPEVPVWARAASPATTPPPARSPLASEARPAEVSRKVVSCRDLERALTDLQRRVSAAYEASGAGGERAGIPARAPDPSSCLRPAGRRDRRVVVASPPGTPPAGSPAAQKMWVGQSLHAAALEAAPREELEAQIYELVDKRHRDMDIIDLLKGEVAQRDRLLEARQREGSAQPSRIEDAERAYTLLDATMSSCEAPAAIPQQLHDALLALRGTSAGCALHPLAEAAATLLADTAGVSAALQDAADILCGPAAPRVAAHGAPRVARALCDVLRDVQATATALAAEDPAVAAPPRPHPLVVALTGDTVQPAAPVPKAAAAKSRRSRPLATRLLADDDVVDALAAGGTPMSEAAPALLQRMVYLAGCPLSSPQPHDRPPPSAADAHPNIMAYLDREVGQLQACRDVLVQELLTWRALGAPFDDEAIVGAPGAHGQTLEAALQGASLLTLAAHTTTIARRWGEELRSAHALARRELGGGTASPPRAATNVALLMDEDEDEVAEGAAALPTALQTSVDEMKRQLQDVLPGEADGEDPSLRSLVARAACTLANLCGDIACVTRAWRGVDASLFPALAIASPARAAARCQSSLSPARSSRDGSPLASPYAAPATPLSCLHTQQLASCLSVEGTSPLGTPGVPMAGWKWTKELLAAAPQVLRDAARWKRHHDEVLAELAQVEGAVSRLLAPPALKAELLRVELRASGQYAEPVLPNERSDDSADALPAALARLVQAPHGGRLLILQPCTAAGAVNDLVLQAAPPQGAASRLALGFAFSADATAAAAAAASREEPTGEERALLALWLRQLWVLVECNVPHAAPCVLVQNVGTGGYLATEVRYTQGHGAPLWEDAGSDVTACQGTADDLPLARTAWVEEPCSLTGCVRLRHAVDGRVLELHERDASAGRGVNARPAHTTDAGIAWALTPVHVPPSVVDSVASRAPIDMLRTPAAVRAVVESRLQAGGLGNAYATDRAPGLRYALRWAADPAQGVVVDEATRAVVLDHVPLDAPPPHALWRVVEGDVIQHVATGLVLACDVRYLFFADTLKPGTGSYSPLRLEPCDTAVAAACSHRFAFRPAGDDAGAFHLLSFRDGRCVAALAGAAPPAPLGCEYPDDADAAERCRFLFTACDEGEVE